MAEKSFLITIGDRTVTGLVNRDQMVGPWQILVADCAVTAATYDSYHGEAMSMGERTPVALLSHAASARMAVAEALTNLAPGQYRSLKRVKLSANWMSAAGHPGRCGSLRSRESGGRRALPGLGITIPVGKDSMSMKTRWQQDGEERSVTSPLSLLISGVCPGRGRAQYRDPAAAHRSRARPTLSSSTLATANNRLGASPGPGLPPAWAKAPDLDNPVQLKGFFTPSRRWWRIAN